MIQIIMVNELESLGHLNYSAQSISIFILFDISQDNWKFVSAITSVIIEKVKYLS